MRIAKHFVPVLILTTLIFGNVAVSHAQQSNSDTRPGVAKLLETITPAVVNIAVQGHATVQTNPLLNDPNFRRFFDVPEQPQTRETQSVGSGVIIDKDKGYVLTNHHVVNNADAIKVILQDKREFEATLIGSDEGTDIALLQIEAKNLSALPLSDSASLRVGDSVMAIGNPFGLGQTVTTGMVSALGRSGINREGYEDFIQTDASINPGNSGGALVDYNGELIGINSAIIAPAGGNVGIGFAVPINMAMAVVDQLLEFGEVKRGLLGVEITDLTPDLVEALELEIREGAVVSRVTPDSAADKAGIKAGDIIVGINGKPIAGSSDLRNTIGLIRAGSQVGVELVREGKRHNLSAVISGAPQTASASVSGKASSVLEGVEFSSIPSSHPASGSVRGVLVSSVDQGSRAFASGLRTNDIITAVNRRPVASPEELQNQLQQLQGAVAMNVVRENQQLFLILR